MMASQKNSYDAPLLTTETEFELLSKSSKNKNQNSHRQPQFNAENTETSRRSNRSSTSAIYYNVPKDSNQFGIAIEQNLIKNGIDINHHRQQASHSSPIDIEFVPNHQNNNHSHVQSN